jgi:hypothetical protein
MSPFIVTAPPSSLSAFPLASATAIFLCAESMTREKVGREFFIRSAAAS